MPTCSNLVLFLGFFCGISSSFFQDNSDVGLNTVEIIENHGYKCENHYITTDDGYILTYQRIPHERNDNSTKQRPAVLLMHGFPSTSADYVELGNRSLGFILADMGYDVWLGNSRGNVWSRNHTSLDVVADGPKFYNFSWHEIGYYDLPAAVDYILKVTGNKGLYYVGHSQGGTAFLVMGSTRPEYNDKIKLASLMAPASIIEHNPNEYLHILCKYIDRIAALLEKYKIYELPYTEFLRKFLSGFCTVPEYVGICESVIFALIGADYEQLDENIFPVVFSNLPSNAGLKQVIHFGQQIKNEGFSQYDYGSEGNKEQYGSEKPPPYDFTKITAPVALYYGNNDALVNFMDEEIVAKKLPNLANDYVVDNFNHFDFIIAKDVVELVYVELISVMQKF